MHWGFDERWSRKTKIPVPLETLRDKYSIVGVKNGRRRPSFTLRPYGKKGKRYSLRSNRNSLKTQQILLFSPDHLKLWTQPFIILPGDYTEVHWHSDKTQRKTENGWTILNVSGPLEGTETPSQPRSAPSDRMMPQWAAPRDAKKCTSWRSPWTYKNEGQARPRLVLAPQWWVVLRDE